MISIEMRILLRLFHIYLGQINYLSIYHLSIGQIKRCRAAIGGTTSVLSSVLVTEKGGVAGMGLAARSL